jgi:hypothetical protein
MKYLRRKFQTTAGISCNRFFRNYSFPTDSFSKQAGDTRLCSVSLFHGTIIDGVKTQTIVFSQREYFLISYGAAASGLRENPHFSGFQGN